jgi:hypothetical protein
MKIVTISSEHIQEPIRRTLIKHRFLTGTNLATPEFTIKFKHTY